MLEPIGDGSVADVVRRLGAIQAQSEQAVELAIACGRNDRARAGSRAP